MDRGLLPRRQRQPGLPGPGAEADPTPEADPRSPRPSRPRSRRPPPTTRGSKGDKGSKGATGDKGSQGSRGSSGSQGTGSPGTTTTEDSAEQGADPVVDETTEEAEGETDADNPYADRLAPPRLTVDGTDVTVTWEAVDQEGFEVQEYVVELNGAEPATVDADTDVVHLHRRRPRQAPLDRHRGRCRRHGAEELQVAERGRRGRDGRGRALGRGDR